MTDKYFLSSFLMFRTIVDRQTGFISNEYNQFDKVYYERKPIFNSLELESYLKTRVNEVSSSGKVGIALSGGIDSAILAKYMPKGSIAYTFKCIVPGVSVVDETKMASEYAKSCGLEHRIVEIFWDDFEKYAPELMKNKNAPIHSIEVQLYKAALQAKKDGIDTLIFGEAADAVYGGLSNLLSKDWLIGDFIERYSFAMPYKILKNSELVLAPFKKFVNSDSGKISPHEFISSFFIKESVDSYLNSLSLAGVKPVLPYPETFLATEIDIKRIRQGENKYLVREIFQRLYPGWVVPPKTPMPRPMNEWFKDWEGPKRSEFWPHCTENMTGDQKWLVWILEKYLDTIS